MSNINIIEFSQYTTPVIKEDSRNDWVEYGENNDYYQYLIDRYTNSTTNNAIINNICRLVYGKGLSATDANKKPNDYAQMLVLFPKDVIRKVVNDLKLLGQGHLQVIYSKDRKRIAKVEHVPTQLVRPEKCNEKGEIEAYYYSNNWADLREYQPQRIPAFGMSNESLEILCIKPYSVGKKYFANVDYQGGIPYALLEEEVADYLINEVKNGFSGTKVINFNNGETDVAKMEEIKNKVMSKLAGSKGEKIIIAFNRNSDSKTTIDDVPLNDAPEHYSYLSEECVRKLMMAHNVTSPLLFGIASTNGFSSNADELKNSSILFDNMVIKPIQDLIIDALDSILAYNKINLNLFFKTLQPLEFVDLENAQTKEQVAEETGVEMSSQSWIDEYGEKPSENWILVDSFDDDGSDEFDFENIKLSQKVLNFVTTGKAVPIARSEQDDEVKGVKYFTRYRYTGKLSDDTRPFCKAMLQADKLYRKEDIMAMSKDARVNPKWGPEGADTYDIFKFKGGGNCHHVWRREVYATLNTDTISPLSNDARKIATSTAEKRGYKIRNPYQVSVQPKNLPYNGFLPTNKRFQ
jgi:hypothetical protein